MTYRHAALSRALTYVGTTEQPPGSNRGHLIDRWNKLAAGVTGVFWCCSFVHAMFAGVGYTLGGGASVQALRQWARVRGLVVKRPLRGDLVCFDFHEGDKYGPFGDHIGIIVRVLALRWRGNTFTGWIKTVEGNTSAQADLTSSQSNGGGVFIRTRWLTNVGAEFVRIPGDVRQT